LLVRKLISAAAIALICSGGLAPSVCRADDKDDEKLFQKVMQRLLSSDIVAEAYPRKYYWPPKYFIKPDSEKEINAYASASERSGAEVESRSGKVRPVVTVTQGMLRQLVKGDENSLAVIMGHELAHLSKDHVGGRKGETALLLLAFGREEEIEADLEGMRFAVASGYPYRAGVANAYKGIRALGKYSSFEGLHTSHPSWEERLSLLDREQAQLWKSMAAFQNGFMFLELEQYPAAQQCFKAVVAEFPDCPEGWANLGYAQLMRYCDGLEADDLRNYGIGQVVAGAFYSRPLSLESQARGVDEKMWQDAVKALNKALALKPDLVLPRANLGLAYLVHPEGKNARQAAKWFKEALERAEADPELKQNMLSRAALLSNAGVADLALGDARAADLKFQAVDRMLDGLTARPLARGLDDALLYNTALIDARAAAAEVKTAACKRLEIYLRTTSPDSAWWTLAFERYGKLCSELKQQAKARNELVKRDGGAPLRVLTSVNVPAGTLTLSAPTAEAVQLLGKDAGAEVPLYPGSKIVRWRFAERGIDLLAREKVLAIFLTSRQAPPVLLQQAGFGAKAKELRVGMAEKDVQEALQGQRADRSLRYIADPRVGYQFYPELGLAVRFADGRLEQMAIAQVPRFSLAPSKNPGDGP
jgi:tetratricopeptide (TPR) repeat protein